MALVKTIKDRNTHDTIYPITKADAVYLSDNETTVEGALGDLSTISSIGDGTIAGAISSLNMNLVKINPTNLSWITNANFNTFTQTGLYTIGSNPENGTYPFSILYVFAPREDTIFQMVERNSHIYVREYRNSSWQDWREL